MARLFQAQFQTRERGSIECQLELDDQLPEVAADPDLLHRAISNLVLNAMDAMPDGGNLTFRTRHDSHSVSIEVADTGTGLTPEECERLFTPYYTSKQHGTGLGLGDRAVGGERSWRNDHRGEHSPDTAQHFAFGLPLQTRIAAAANPKLPVCSDRRS